MDEKKKSAIEKIVQLSLQDVEFNDELRKKLNTPPPAKVVPAGDDRIDHIYEYCIENVVKQQADDFYKDFPLPEITPGLKKDFIRMETFRRKDAFGDFCLALYQQIECITNHLCMDKRIDSVVSKMRKCPSLVKWVKDEKENATHASNIEERNKHSRTIEEAILINKNQEDKTKKSLNKQGALDKVRIITYFIGLNATTTNLNNYTEFQKLISDIYNCRNQVHRGSEPTSYQEKSWERIKPLQSLYSFKFMGALAQYVTFIREGWPKFPQVEEYANKLGDRIAPESSSSDISRQGPKIVGWVELPPEELNKKRFK